MDNNDYNRLAKIEQEKAQAEAIQQLIEGQGNIVAELREVKKELRTAREELRNIGKLKPLRSKPEEEVEKPVEDQTEIVTQ